MAQEILSFLSAAARSASGNDRIREEEDDLSPPDLFKGLGNGLPGVAAVPVHHRHLQQGQAEPGEGELEGGDAGDHLPAPLAEPRKHGVAG